MAEDKDEKSPEYQAVEQALSGDLPVEVPFWERASIRPRELAALKMRLRELEQQISGENIKGNKVFCPKCGALMGVEVCVENQIWLRDGNKESYADHGRCAICGNEFHWTVDDVRLARLIASCK